MHRATWAAGDYASVAMVIDEAPPRHLLAHARVAPGHEVLDVATGTGNIAAHVEVSACVLALAACGG